MFGFHQLAALLSQEQACCWLTLSDGECEAALGSEWAAVSCWFRFATHDSPFNALLQVAKLNPSSPDFAAQLEKVNARHHCCSACVGAAQHPYDPGSKSSRCGCLAVAISRCCPKAQF